MVVHEILILMDDPSWFPGDQLLLEANKMSILIFLLLFAPLSSPYLDENGERGLLGASDCSQTCVAGY